MNKKGFTLIEIIVAVSLLLAITVIAVPSILDISNKNKQKEYNGYVDGFIAGAKLYVTDQSLDSNTDCSDFPHSIPLANLIDGEYINENIPENPLTGTKFANSSFVTISCNATTHNLSYAFTAN